MVGRAVWRFRRGGEAEVEFGKVESVDEEEEEGEAALEDLDDERRRRECTGSTTARKAPGSSFRLFTLPLALRLLVVVSRVKHLRQLAGWSPSRRRRSTPSK
jgi:hypothetical protein